MFRNQREGEAKKKMGKREEDEEKPRERAPGSQEVLAAEGDAFGWGRCS